LYWPMESNMRLSSLERIRLGRNTQSNFGMQPTAFGRG